MNLGDRVKFKKIFTEYDERLEKTLNLDPMGFGIIWTHFGQRIFNNKISSSSWDIRSFNINLFNHFVIKSLMDKGTDEIKNLFEINKKLTIEKMILILENMLIWSWYKDKDSWNRKNLLGTSKAISMWNKKNINIDIKESINNLELLKGQKSVGVNGRYKGSFVNMGFFDSNYNDNVDNVEFFREVDKLIKGNKLLEELHSEVKKCFDNGGIENIPIKKYKEAFSKIENLASYTKDFWIKKLSFDKDEAEVIYNAIDKNDAKSIFQNAYNKKPSEKFKIILKLEPKLSYMDALFNYLLFYDGVEVSEIEKEDFFGILKSLDFEDEISITTDGVKARLIELNRINDVESLIGYHRKVMEDRGYVSWLKIHNDRLVVDLKSKEDKKKLLKKLEVELDSIPWLHSYYIGSVRSIKEGLTNETI